MRMEKLCNVGCSELPQIMMCCDYHFSIDGPTCYQGVEEGVTWFICNFRVIYQFSIL